MGFQMRTTIRTKLLAALMALLIGCAGLSDALAQKPAPSSLKKPAASAKKKAPKAPVKRAAKRPVRRRVATRRAPAPANQRVPTKDRYAEIQQALADAGHFAGAPDGAWKQESIEALKSFQSAQGFEPTGRIDARSLIKMGLGPQYESRASNTLGATEETSPAATP